MTSIDVVGRACTKFCGNCKKNNVTSMQIFFSANRQNDNLAAETQASGHNPNLVAKTQFNGRNPNLAVETQKEQVKKTIVVKTPRNEQLK